MKRSTLVWILGLGGWMVVFAGQSRADTMLPRPAGVFHSISHAWDDAGQMDAAIPPEPEGLDSVLPGDDGWLSDATSECTAICDQGSACGGLGVLDAWLACQPIRSMKSGLKERFGIDSGGWVQIGYTANAGNPADNFNGPLLMNDRAGEAQMNELWLYFSRPVDTEGDGFDIGGRVDLLYGTDWRAALYHGFGLEDRINGQDQLYGFSPAQFYAEVGINNLSIKAGRMTGILGYEVVPPMLSFFYSRSYALCYGEPILITGAMASYQLDDQITLLGGAHQGVHRFEDNNDRLNFQGGVMWTSCDERTSLSYALDIGQNDFLPELFGLEDEYIHSIVFKYQLNPRMLYVLQHDLGAANGVNGYQDAEWYSIGQYLLYTLNEKWSAGGRLEWFRDDDGTRVLGLGNLPARGWGAAPGFNGAFTSLTLGLNWKPRINVLVRPEIRWDWYDGSRNLMGELPFDGGNRSDQFTAAIDAVVMF
jgi:hypothetical protein